jgi:hypothetical protein
LQLHIPISRHEHFNVPPWIKPIQLVNQLQHGPLHLIIPTCPIIKPCTANGVDFVEEDDTRLLTSCHFEELANHTCALANVFLDQLGTNDANKGCICAIGYCAGAESLAGSRGTEQEDTFWGINSELDESFGLKA